MEVVLILLNPHLRCEVLNEEMLFKKLCERESKVTRYPFIEVCPIFAF